MDEVQQKAFIKLIIGCAFIAILFLLSYKSNNIVNNNIEEKKEVTYQEKLDKLNSNYEYEYKIIIEDNTYSYKGSKMIISDNNKVKEHGIKLTNNETTLEYFIENNYIYEVKDGGLDKIESIYNDINENYVNVSYIKDLIKEVEYNVNENTYNYDLENSNIKIITNDDNINEIIINLNDSSYDLLFNNINLVKEVKY